MGVYFLQTKQNDSQQIWGDLSEKMISSNLENLLSQLDNFLSSTKKCNETLDLLEKKFSNSKKDIEVSLKKIFILISLIQILFYNLLLIENFALFYQGKNFQ